MVGEYQLVQIQVREPEILYLSNKHFIRIGLWDSQKTNQNFEKIFEIYYLDPISLNLYEFILHQISGGGWAYDSGNWIADRMCDISKLV